MGLFDFVKDIGNKVFGNEAEAAEKIQQHIEAANPGIENMQVNFNNGEVSLAGTATSPEAMEKAVLMAGNVKGVGKVTASGLNIASGQAVAEDANVEYYTIKSGDTLSGISKDFYGSANRYMQIFEANREVIKDPDKIFVGQKIRIPKNA